jgi:hypothetical protein
MQTQNSAIVQPLNIIVTLQTLVSKFRPATIIAYASSPEPTSHRFIFSSNSLRQSNQQMMSANLQNRKSLQRFKQ